MLELVPQELHNFPFIVNRVRKTSSNSSVTSRKGITRGRTYSLKFSYRISVLIASRSLIDYFRITRALLRSSYLKTDFTISACFDKFSCSYSPVHNSSAVCNIVSAHWFCFTQLASTYSRCYPLVISFLMHTIRKGNFVYNNGLIFKFKTFEKSEGPFLSIIFLLQQLLL